MLVVAFGSPDRSAVGATRARLPSTMPSNAVCGSQGCCSPRVNPDIGSDALSSWYIFSSLCSLLIQGQHVDVGTVLQCAYEPEPVSFSPAHDHIGQGTGEVSAACFEVQMHRV